MSKNKFELNKFEWIGEDLMVEVFVKVGQNLKSLVRLRCVSKSWQRLVNSQCFPRLTCNVPLEFKGHLMKVEFGRGSLCLIDTSVLAYTAHHCQGDSDHFGQEEEGRRLLEKVEDRGLVFLDACNGLILHRLNNNDNNNNDDSNDNNPTSSPPPVYRVSNLETNSCVVVNGEPDTADSMCNKMDHAVLAYDPAESFLSFKIVAFFRRPTPPFKRLLHKCVRIYSSKTGKWSPDLNFDHHILHCARSNWSQQSVYCNGAIYRLTVRGYLIRFEVKDDEENYDECRAQAIQIPKDPLSDLIYPMLVGINKGQINFTWPTDFDGDFKVWVLQEEGHGSNYSYQWILKHNFPDFKAVARLLHVPPFSRFRPFGFHPYEDAVVFFVVDRFRFRFVCWHLDKNTASVSAKHHVIRDAYQPKQVMDRPYSFPLFSCAVPLQ